jgi:cyclohexyl-isocyanide hydratase
LRWIYHLRERGAPIGDRYTPESLAREGFVHGSFRDAVRESSRLYFPERAELEVLQIDPRRLDVPLEIAETPRGPMPHVHGAIPRDAVRATIDLAKVDSMPDRVTGTRFAFVAFDGMTLLDLVGALDPVSRIASMQIEPTTTCEVVSATRNVVWSECGAEMRAASVRPDLSAYDVVVVAGGPGARALCEDGEVVSWLAAFPRNRLVASVCTGALLLGAAGRLEGMRATTHHTALDRLAAYGARAVAERVVDEGQVVTAGGVTSGIDLGLHLVWRFEGDEAFARVAAQMEVSARAPSAAPSP